MVQVLFFGLGWKAGNALVASGWKSKKRGCGPLLLGCVGDFRGCRAGLSVRPGTSPEARRDLSKFHWSCFRRTAHGSGNCACLPFVFGMSP